MYGTVARLRLKPGMEEAFKELGRQFQSLQVPGFVGQHVYQTDADPTEFYLVVLFEDKDAYAANANSPEQHARYEQYVQLLAAEPEWHDGEVIHSYLAS